MSDPNDFRQLCAELVDDLEEWVDGYLVTDEANDAVAESFDRINRTRAALEGNSGNPIVRRVVEQEPVADTSAQSSLNA